MTDVELAPFIRGTNNRSQSASSQSLSTYSPWHLQRNKVAVFFGGTLLLLLLLTLLERNSSSSGAVLLAAESSSLAGAPPTMAFCGNSMLYYNDCPRLVEILLTRLYYYDNIYGNNSSSINTTTSLTSLLLEERIQSHRLQDSCLHGGANLDSLWSDGNGMGTAFSTTPAADAGATRATNVSQQNIDENVTTVYDIGALSVESLLLHPPMVPSLSSSSSSAATTTFPWKYVLLQDSELVVTKATSRQSSIRVLREHYLRTIKSSLSDSSKSRQQRYPGDGLSPPPPASTTVLLFQTFAYQSARLRETTGFGGFDDFTDAIVQGYEAYSEVVRDEFGLACRMIPMAQAVQYLSKADPELWALLYNSDFVHPSPHGTWLQACLTVAVATNREPPVWDEMIASTWEHRARFWQSKTGRRSGKPLPLPTAEEAEKLRQVACRFAFS